MANLFKYIWIQCNNIWFTHKKLPLCHPQKSIVMCFYLVVTYKNLTRHMENHILTMWKVIGFLVQFITKVQQIGWKVATSLPSPLNNGYSNLFSPLVIFSFISLKNKTILPLAIRWRCDFHVLGINFMA